MFDRELDYRHTPHGFPCDAAQRILPIEKSRNESGFSMHASRQNDY